MFNNYSKYFNHWNSLEYYTGCPTVRTCAERKKTKQHKSQSFIVKPTILSLNEENTCFIVDFYIKIYNIPKDLQKDFREALKTFNLAIDTICKNLGEDIKNSIIEFLKKPDFDNDEYENIDKNIKSISQEIPLNKQIMAFIVFIYIIPHIYYCDKTYKEISNFILEIDEVLDSNVLDGILKNNYNIKIDNIKNKIRNYCQKCSNGYFDGNKCILGTCPPTLYYNTETTDCLKSCQSLYYKNEETKKCVKTCPKYYYDSSCVNICPTNAPYRYNNKCYSDCANTRKDKEIVNKTYTNKKDNECVEKCPKYYDTLNNICVDECPASTPYRYDNRCYSYCGLTKFDAEIGNKITYKIGNECVAEKECPNYYNTITGECVDKCPVNAYSYGNKCYSDCYDTPIKTYKNGNTCVDLCPSDKTYIYKNECVDKCPADTVISPYSNECNDF